MNHEEDLSKTQFIDMWTKDGFVHSWDAYQKDYKDDILAVVSTLVNKESSTVLEIGCGGGYWTSSLNDLSKKMYAVDLLPRPNIPEDVVYIELGDKQYSIPKIKNNSIDLIFSYGVFCHLSKRARQEYIKDIKRVMKRSGCAIIMFSDNDKLIQQTGSDYKSIGFYHDTYQETCDFLNQIRLKYSNVLGEDYPRVLLKITK